MKILSGSTWSRLMFLLIPLTLAFILHILTPLLLHLHSYERIPQAYNSLKVQEEHTTIMTLTKLSAQYIQYRWDALHSKKNILINIFKNSMNQKIQKISNISLNSGADLVNLTNKNKSIWYSSGINSTSQFSPAHKKIYEKYLRMEPYLQNFIGKRQGVQFELYWNQLGKQMYFHYPTQSLEKYQNLNLTNYFSKTIQYWNLYGYTFYNQIKGDILYDCEVILNKSIANGVFCMELSLTYITEQLLNKQIPYHISTLVSYLLRPSYLPYSEPQIICKIDYSTGQLKIYHQPTFLPNTFQNVPEKQWKPTHQKHFLYIVAKNRSSIYYHIPILRTNVSQKIENIFYLQVQNIFNVTKFTSQATVAKTLHLIIIPGLVMFFVAIIVSFFVIKCILADLQNGLDQLNTHCENILNGNVDVIIPEYNQTEDLRELYCKYKTINKLHNITSEKYYAKDKQNQNYLQYLKVLNTYEQLNYDNKKVKASLGNCCYNIGDYEMAAEYYKQCFQLIKLDLEQIGTFEEIIQIWLRNDKNIQEDISEQLNYLTIILYHLIISINFTLSPSGIEQNKEFEQYINLYKKSSVKKYSGNLIDVMHIEIAYFLLIKQLKKAQYLLEQTQKKMVQYVNLYNSNNLLQSGIINDDPEIMAQSLNLIKAIKFMNEKQLATSFKYFYKTLSGTTINFQQHKRIIHMFEKLLIKLNILQKVNKTIYFTQHDQGSIDRQFIFLIDSSYKNKLFKEQIREQNKIILEKAKYIFNEFLDDNDRVSVSTITPLMFKAKNQRLLSQQFNLLKNQKLTKIKIDVIKAIKYKLNKVVHLENQKIFVVLLKDHTTFNKSKIQAMIRENKNNKIKIIIIQMQPKIKLSQYYYHLDFPDDEALGCILMNKCLNKKLKQQSLL